VGVQAEASTKTLAAPLTPRVSKLLKELDLPFGKHPAKAMPIGDFSTPAKNDGAASTSDASSTRKSTPPLPKSLQAEYVSQGLREHLALLQILHLYFAFNIPSREEMMAVCRYIDAEVRRLLL